MEKGNLGVPQLTGQGCSFHGFRTNTYKLSFMESPSGIKVSQSACNTCFGSIILSVAILISAIMMHYAYLFL